MNPRTFTEALTNYATYRNRDLQYKLAGLLSQADWVEHIRGKVQAYIPLSREFQSHALGICAWDRGRHCTTNVTHDLSSMAIHDLTGLITAMRTEDN